MRCPFMATRFTMRGLTIFIKSQAVVFINISARDSFMPPPVLPAIAPISMRITIRLCEYCGQRVKSAVPKPVELDIVRTLKNEYRSAFIKPPY